MRVEPYSVGSYVHVFKRGTRRMDIVRDDADRWRFLKLLRYLNDENIPRNWEREIGPDHIREGFSRPKRWGQSKPHVSLLAYCLMDNHFHLLIREHTEGGLSKFMHRLCTSMSTYFNEKYDESGTLFQGAYKARTVRTDRQLQYLAAYIQVKNTLELYPGGLNQASKEIDDALVWAQSYPFCSLFDYLTEPRSALLDTEAVSDVFPHGDTFRRFARDVMLGRKVPDGFAELIIDE